MELQEIMRQRVFAVVGNTLDSEKYAYKIKQGMLEKGYTVYAVGKELSSLNDVPEEIDIIDLCIHPAKGLKLMQECKKSFKCIVLQPGAESAELVAYLEEKEMPYINGCLLVGMRLFT
ncbi:CoA-binding protein [Oscillibacter sp.]|uniref:CoA-binding protein n=1 Tax=Oscillibacter sp. TaxID=1945593 RepID=UPI0028A91C61|nr:CoA-binding protein [Oscillibacter sp.]